MYVCQNWGTKDVKEGAEVDCPLQKEKSSSARRPRAFRKGTASLGEISWRVTVCDLASIWHFWTQIKDLFPSPVDTIVHNFDLVWLQAPFLLQLSCPCRQRIAGHAPGRPNSPSPALQRLTSFAGCAPVPTKAVIDPRGFNKPVHSVPAPVYFCTPKHHVHFSQAAHIGRHSYVTISSGRSIHLNVIGVTKEDCSMTSEVRGVPSTHRTNLGESGAFSYTQAKLGDVFCCLQHQTNETWHSIPELMDIFVRGWHS
eukprot:1160128-Pelagomonas_calceolata.AAC.19